MPSMIRNGFMILCMGTCHIGILIPEHANKYLYIHTQNCCVFDLFCTRNFLRLVIPLTKNAHSKSSQNQALNNASTVGGPVAVWMPSQEPQQPTSGGRPPADEPTSGCCEDFV